MLLYAYAVLREGHVAIDADGNGVVSVTSFWPTREEAEYAIERVWSRNFGTWTAKRSWVEYWSNVPSEQISNLIHSAPEMCEPGNWVDR